MILPKGDDEKKVKKVANFISLIFDERQQRFETLS